MSEVNFTVGKTWIKSHAFRAPASHIHEDGQIQKKLVKKAKVLTDIKDSLLCPTEDEKVRILLCFILLHFVALQHETLNRDLKQHDTVMRRWQSLAKCLFNNCHHASLIIDTI